VLALEDLTKRYGEIVALDGLSFEARPGRILGFLGPNGAGKTTAMRAVFGLLRPDSGVVRWNGHPIGHEDRLRMGYMPEERGLYPKMRVHEQLAFFARLSGLSSNRAAEAAMEWLTLLGIADRAGSKVEELSHGNQQRVQLAASLVHEPDVAILDEPFAGLDPIGMETMAASLRRLARGGTAIVFSSHQLDLVEDVCQDVVIIDSGRAVLTGEVAELRRDAPIRHLAIELDGRSWVPDVPMVEQIDVNGETRCIVQRGASIDELLSLAEAAPEGEVTRFSFEPPTLSDLFREAVRR
jgi:ABC-2 type transport system ATP-binding protein